MPKKILVVDDDRLVPKSLKRLLEHNGYIVYCAESSQEALGLINQTEFDLVILDIRMPGINGIETAHNIRGILKKGNKKSVPIIFITRYFNENSYNEAQKIDASDFIYKPFDKDKFLQSIKTALGNK